MWLRILTKKPTSFSSGVVHEETLSMKKAMITTAIFIVILFIANLVAVYEVYYKIPELLINVQQMLGG